MFNPIEFSDYKLSLVAYRQLYNGHIVPDNFPNEKKPISFRNKEIAEDEIEIK